MARTASLPLAIAAALLVAAGAFGQQPSNDEIKQFRQALESHWNGNLPQLLRYLRRLDPAADAANPNPDPPGEGSAPGWSPRARWGTDSMGRRYLIESAADVRRRWRRRVETELRRFAAGP